MPHLDKIVECIDNHLKSTALKSKSFQGGRYWGLAKSVIIEDSERTKKPSIVSKDGHGEEVTPDETYPFSMYHRCLGASPSANTKTGFGSDTGFSWPVEMLSVVYGDPKKLNITQEDLAFVLFHGLQLTDNITVSGSKVGAFKVVPGRFNNDSYQVFTGEYQSEAYPLKPESIFFSLSYRIEISADRTCVICS